MSRNNCECRNYCSCSICDDKNDACRVGKYLTIIGKPNQTKPCVNKPCQGQRWISNNYQTEYVFNNCEWHLVDQKPGCAKVLLDYQFKEHTANDVLADFNSNVFGTDGSLSIDSEGLLITANPFTATIPIGNEHTKHLRYYKNSFPVSDDYETLYETEIAVKQFIPINDIPAEFLPRLRNVWEDIRLCSGAINVLDPINWIVCDIFLSDEKIYCFVERLPFGKTLQHNYAAYSNCVAVVCRTGDPLNDFVKVSIGLKKTKAFYYINDELVFTVPRFGVRELDEHRLLDHQGVSETVSVDSFYLGFGLFSLLDMQLPYNYARQLVVNDFGDNQSASGLVQLDLDASYGEVLPGKLTGDNRAIINPSVTWGVTLNQYIDDNKQVKLFGQGATLRMKYFKVCIRY